MFEWQPTPFTVPFAVSAVVAAAVFTLVARNRVKRAADPLLGVLAGAFVWSVVILLQLSSPSLEAKLFWNAVRFVAPPVAVLSMFLFAAVITGRKWWLKWRRVVVLAVPAVLFNLAVWTNPLHSWFWTAATLDTAGSYALLEITYGPLFVAHVLYHYGLLVWTLYWLVDAYLRSRDGKPALSQTQVGLVLFAMVIPWVVNIAFALEVTEVDLTPIGFAATGVLFGTGLFRYRLLDIVPIARSTVIDSMDNGVLVVDTDSHIVDANPPLKDAFDLNGESLIGTDIQATFEAYPTITETLSGTDRGRERIEVQQNGEKLYYELHISPISDSFEERVGRAVVFENVTTQVERQRELAAREEELDLMQQVQSRVLRHNIRNDVQVIKAHNEKLATALDGEHGRRAQQALDKADELLETSRKVRTIHRFVERKQVETTVDIREALRTVVAEVDADYPNVSISFDVPEQCQAETHPEIRRVFRNLIENAAEHNDSDNPAVEVTATESDSDPSGPVVVISVRDNGPGIPSQELAVIERREETPLEHVRGLGMWVIDWVITNTAASVEFDTGADGTDARVRIPCDGSRGCDCRQSGEQE